MRGWDTRLSDDSWVCVRRGVVFSRRQTENGYKTDVNTVVEKKSRIAKIWVSVPFYLRELTRWVRRGKAGGVRKGRTKAPGREKASKEKASEEKASGEEGGQEGRMGKSRRKEPKKALKRTEDRTGKYSTVPMTLETPSAAWARLNVPQGAETVKIESLGVLPSGSAQQPVKLQYLLLIGTKAWGVVWMRLVPAGFAVDMERRRYESVFADTEWADIIPTPHMYTCNRIRDIIGCYLRSA
jgi:hypothetical protein